MRALLKETSVVLALAANPIFRVLKELPELRAEMFAQPALNLAGYQLLVEGLKRKDPTVAQPSTIDPWSAASGRNRDCARAGDSGSATPAGFRPADAMQHPIPSR